jgi:DNA-binding NtrC family response regulator
MGDPRSPSILVVDDDKNQRTMLAFALRDQGYLVVAVDSGALALELAKAERFDAAICDIMMPEMDGVETLKLLKQAQPGLEVIMATGYASPATALASMKNGAYNYIAKPYEIKDLFMVLKRALEKAARKDS